MEMKGIFRRKLGVGSKFKIIFNIFWVIYRESGGRGGIQLS